MMKYNIRVLLDEEIKLAKDLFCIGFDSTSEEAEIFFQPKEKNIIGAFQGNNLCSMLTVYDCKAVLMDEVLDTGYMAGVTTSPLHRGNNLFARCFEFYLEEHNRYKMVFCIPASESLFDFYKKAGMNDTTFVKEVLFENNNRNSMQKDVKILTNGDNLDEYVSKVKEYNLNNKLYIKKDEELCISASRAFMFYGGKIAISEGLTALYYEKDDVLNIVDIATNDFEKAIDDIKIIFSNKKKIRVILPHNKYTEKIDGKMIPIALCLKTDKKINVDGLYINTLFNDI